MRHYEFFPVWDMVSVVGSSIALVFLYSSNLDAELSRAIDGKASSINPSPKEMQIWCFSMFLFLALNNILRLLCLYEGVKQFSLREHGHNNTKLVTYLRRIQILLQFLFMIVACVWLLYSFAMIMLFIVLFLYLGFRTIVTFYAIFFCVCWMYAGSSMTCMSEVEDDDDIEFVALGMPSQESTTRISLTVVRIPVFILDPILHASELQRQEQLRQNRRQQLINRGVPFSILQTFDTLDGCPHLDVGAESVHFPGAMETSLSKADVGSELNHATAANGLGDDADESEDDDEVSTLAVVELKDLAVSCPVKDNENVAQCIICLGQCCKCMTCVCW